MVDTARGLFDEVFGNDEVLGNDKVLGNPLLNVGIGLLSASGPSRTPVSTGQALAQGLSQAQRAQQQQLQNRIVRGRLSQEARKRAAAGQLSEMFGGDPQVGALAEIAPEAVAQGLLGQVLPKALTPLETATLANANATLENRQRKAAADRANLEDAFNSADAGIKALDTIDKIPGADVFLTTPSLIAQTRQAMTLGRLDPTGLLQGLPSKVSGIPREQLEIALNAAETVGKQRNALGLGLSNQAGTAGLRARLQAFGEGAGPTVQRGVFEQARDRIKRQADLAGNPLDIEALVPHSPGPGKTQQVNAPTASQIANRRSRPSQPAAAPPPRVPRNRTVPLATFGSVEDFNKAVAEGRITTEEAGQFVRIGDQLFPIEVTQ